MSAQRDLLKPETRDERKRAHYEAASRWAKRLPGEKGEDKRKAYELMRQHLFAALRA